MGPTRREFAGVISMAIAGLAVPRAGAAQPARRGLGRPRAHEFVFARLRYDSGDWDYNPKVAANVLNSVVEYTNIPVYPEEVVITADSEELGAFPVPVHDRPQAGPLQRPGARSVSRGSSNTAGCSSPTTATTTWRDSMRRRSRPRCARIFPGKDTLAKIPTTHPLYRSFFPFPDGPPQTAHELNGWGDDLVHDYLRGVERRGRLGVIYSNKDYGCEWDYDWRNKRFQRDDNTKFAVNIVTYALTA